jgi:hypothetical protein
MRRRVRRASHASPSRRLEADIALGLVDEYRLFVYPVVLGRGACAKHAIGNTITEPLEYSSATAPPFPAEIRGDTSQPGYERSSAENA